jgi:hypothetical protein
MVRGVTSETKQERGNGEMVADGTSALGKISTCRNQKIEGKRGDSPGYVLLTKKNDFNKKPSTTTRAT